MKTLFDRHRYAMQRTERLALFTSTIRVDRFGASSIETCRHDSMDSHIHIIDATNRVVAPGFIDVHTHYDAQAFWDGTLSPSPFHGVTSVIGGNCGFSIAPLSPEAGDYLMRMLARVEGMPLESLQVGVPWDWSSFGEYLDKLEGGLGVNAGFQAVAVTVD